MRASLNQKDQLILDQLLEFVLENSLDSSKIKLKLDRTFKKFRKSDGSLFAKDELIAAYLSSCSIKKIKPDLDLLRHLQLKPTRTISGVTPVTVLTKPFPCPGKCIFCPSDIRMPKSYLSDEPGAQRAERNWFDPYLQTYNRLQAYQSIGHPTEKIELIVLGGTWSFYPHEYQIWFVKECFRALNEFGSKIDSRPDTLKRYEQMESHFLKEGTYASSCNPAQNKLALKAHEVHGEKLSKSYNLTVSQLYVAPEKIAGFDEYQKSTWEKLEKEQLSNEVAVCRCVGLVIETRPDNISEEEVRRIRRLGCTKTQIGIQSLNDEVLSKNHRGHDVAATRKAFNLLRQAGFKVHAHWMPNLYGSSVDQDKADYLKLFNDPDFMPDELKIYPCSLIESAELMTYFKNGSWVPYSKEQLSEVLTFCLANTPEYCRLTRIIRDIPSTDIVAGNKQSNFREVATKSLLDSGQVSIDIRAREIRDKKISLDQLFIKKTEYQTSNSREVFIQFVSATGADQLVKSNLPVAAFLRLSLPTSSNYLSQIKNCAMIREVHVYGPAMSLGSSKNSPAQHLGLGTRLIEEAKQLAIEANFDNITVISAVGTRKYYRQRGFVDNDLYQFLALS